MPNKKLDPHKKKNENDIEMVLLKSINNSMELNFIKNLLDENKIPYMLKDHGSGGYMRIASGFSIYGTDILVEKSMYEKAKAIIDEFPWED